MNSTFQNPLTSLNVTNVLDVTKEQFVNIANNTLAIPDMIAIFCFMSLMFLIIGLILVKNSRGRLVIIWFSTTLLGAIFLIILATLPNTAFDYFQTIKGWFN